MSITALSVMVFRFVGQFSSRRLQSVKFCGALEVFSLMVTLKIS